jgi:diadenosine tetraphosphatase ApaH/serine/threonine PP2A family protein phosphatase
MEAVFLDYFLVHSSPIDPDKWHYILGLDQAKENFSHFSQAFCLIGHSHHPVIFECDADEAIIQSNKSKIKYGNDKRYIINIGSVGQPRDNDPRACYVIADTESNEIYYRRVEYDLLKTQDKMRRANLPDFLIERLASGV